jgi:hypothetical protein
MMSLEELRAAAGTGGKKLALELVIAEALRRRAVAEAAEAPAS